MLNTEIRVTNTHNYDVVRSVAFKVIIPEVAEKLLHLVTQVHLGHIFVKTSDIAVVGKEGRDIDVKNTVAVADRPVNIWEDRIDHLLVVG